MPDARLDLLEPSVVRYSSGFLRIRPEVWLSSISAHWMPLLQTLGVDLEIEDISGGFDFPDELARVTPLEIDGEVAVIGLDAASQETLVSLISPASGELESDLVMEYVERRLVSTISKSWQGSGDGFQCFYISSDKIEEAEVVGVVAVRLSVAGRPVNLWFGCGPRLLEKLDTLWRQHVHSSVYGDEDLNGSRQIASVQLAELAVPPAMLIDYLRPGTVINLGFPVSDSVVIKLDGKDWAQGRLAQMDSQFVVEVNSVGQNSGAAPEATTIVLVELARFSLDSASIAEYSQLGAVVITDTAAANTATLLIGNEVVANALVVENAGEFALQILPR